MTRTGSSPVEVSQSLFELSSIPFQYGIPPVTITAPQDDPAGNRHPFQDVYKFVSKQINFNTVSLGMETHHIRSIPRYYISVSMDCMMPTASITSVYRHDMDGSTMVAEIGMGISSERAMLTMREESGPMDNIFIKSHKEGWDWKRRKPRPDGAVSIVNLHWEESSLDKVIDCYLTGDAESRLGTAVAFIIIPPMHQANGGRASRSQMMLEVTALGLDVLDDIVVSAIIVQRRRLSPNVKDRTKTPIFN